MRKALTERQEEDLYVELITWLDQMGYKTSQINYDSEMRAYIPIINNLGETVELYIPDRYQQVA